MNPFTCPMCGETSDVSMFTFVFRGEEARKLSCGECDTEWIAAPDLDNASLEEIESAVKSERIDRLKRKKEHRKKLEDNP